MPASPASSDTLGSARPASTPDHSDARSSAGSSEEEFYELPAAAAASPAMARKGVTRRAARPVRGQRAVGGPDARTEPSSPDPVAGGVDPQERLDFFSAAYHAQVRDLIATLEADLAAARAATLAVTAQAQAAAAKDLRRYNRKVAKLNSESLLLITANQANAALEKEVQQLRTRRLDAHAELQHELQGVKDELAEEAVGSAEAVAELARVEAERDEAKEEARKLLAATKALLGDFAGGGQGEGAMTTV